MKKRRKRSRARQDGRLPNVDPKALRQVAGGVAPLVVGGLALRLYFGSTGPAQ